MFLEAVKSPGLTLEVGVFGDAAAAAAIDGDGLTVGELADIHEHTSFQGQAPRAPIRRTIDSRKEQIKTGMRRGAERVLRGQMTTQQVLDLLGFAIVGWIQEEIAAGIPPPLSPNYIPRKMRKYPGATTPLIASGQLRGSYTHIVKQHGGK